MFKLRSTGIYKKMFLKNAVDDFDTLVTLKQSQSNQTCYELVDPKKD